MSDSEDMAGIHTYIRSRMCDRPYCDKCCTLLCHYGHRPREIGSASKVSAKQVAERKQILKKGRALRRAQTIATLRASILRDQAELKWLEAGADDE